jgi:hypothetical protein
MVLNSSSDLTSVTPMVAVDAGKAFEGGEGAERTGDERWRCKIAVSTF